jgi:hypothetical protein
MLLATANATKSAQRQLVQETLKFHQKLRFWYFKNFKKTSICRRGTKACAHRSDSHSKNFSYAYFIV